ncbi:dihydrouridine synthase DuS [mine drainage metagenome]|uniref:Dihydrouridine synthase DuS n=1 Tax=mine drainage metagenome TaxID=410659 RepID=T1D9J2_9ZZZZ
MTSKYEQRALDYAKKYQLDGIMIGRGIFEDPYAFSDQSDWANFDKYQKIDLFKKHVKLFLSTYRNNERSQNVMKRFCKIYLNNFSGAKELREAVMAQKTLMRFLQS